MTLRDAEIHLSCLSRLLQGRSKVTKLWLTIVTFGPNEFFDRVTLPRDDRLIYFSLRTTEADIWLMTLNELQNVFSPRTQHLVKT